MFSSVDDVCVALAATANAQRQGQAEPDARVIYSTAADGDMIVVFNTTKHSRKYMQLMENPQCALTFVHKPYAGEFASL